MVMGAEVMEVQEDQPILTPLEAPLIPTSVQAGKPQLRQQRNPLDP